MWRRIVWYARADVSDKPVASNCSECGESRFFRSVVKYFQYCYTASHPGIGNNGVILSQMGKINDYQYCCCLLHPASQPDRQSHCNALTFDQVRGTAEGAAQVQETDHTGVLEYNHSVIFIWTAGLSDRGRTSRQQCANVPAVTGYRMEACKRKKGTGKNWTVTAVH